MKLSLACSLLAAALCATAMAESRKWTDAASGRSIDAEFVSQTDAKVTLRLKDGKEVALDKTRLSKADQEFLKTATAPAAPSVAATAGSASRAVNFDSVKIDKRAWTRPGSPKDLKVTTVDFPLQLETPHFFIAGTPKVKAEVMDVYAEAAERLWTHMVRDIPGIESLFKDKRMMVWLEESETAHNNFGKWVAKNTNRGFDFSWEEHTISYVTLTDEYAGSQKLLTASRAFRTDSKGNHRNLKWPPRIHFLAGDIFRMYLDEVERNEECMTGLMGLGYAYYLEGDVCGNITTEVSFGGGGSVEGFKNGRAWPATIKNLLKNPVVKPGIEKILKTDASKAEPMDIGSVFALMHWCLRDPVRNKAFNALLESAIKDKKTPTPAAFAKAMGFDSADAFDAALVAYMKSDQFK
jgi:hypothetical protein